jgi:hypothetical protein
VCQCAHFVASVHTGARTGGSVGGHERVVSQGRRWALYVDGARARPTK